MFRWIPFLLLSFSIEAQAQGPAVPAGTGVREAPDRSHVGAHRMPCPLEGLPSGELAWVEQGRIWILEGDDVILFSDTGLPLTSMDGIVCAGTSVTFTVFHGDRLKRIDRAHLDLKAALAGHVPRPTPEARLDQALNEGHLQAAVGLLDKMDPSKPAVAAKWIELADLAVARKDLVLAAKAISSLPQGTAGATRIQAVLARESMTAARAALEGGDAGGALVALGPALSSLGRDLPEWTEPERRATRVLWGRLMAATGDWKAALGVLESVVVEHPEEALAWLSLGDARWALADKKGARDAYLQASRLLPPGAFPTAARERCRKCGR